MSSRLISYPALAAALGAAIWLMWPSTRPMPETTFNLLDGRTLSSSELRGKKLLITFWSVSCEICLRDMPRLTRLQESLTDHGLMVIGVAMPHDPPPAIIGVVERRKPGYSIALDVHGEVSAAFGGIKVTPSTFLIDQNGNIRYSERGSLDESRIRATISTF